MKILLILIIIVLLAAYYYNKITSKEQFTSSGTVMQLVASGRQDRYLTGYEDDGTRDYDGWKPGVPDERRPNGMVTYD